METLKDFNKRLAIQITLLVSTMACVYLFTFWALLPLVLPSTRDFVFYISSSVLQLSLLPLIMVGQKLLGQETEKRDTEQYNAVMEMLSDMRSEHEERREILEDVRMIVQELAEAQVIK